MTKTIIATDQAPAAIGPYVQATRIGNMVYTSGQIPLDPVSMDVVEGGIEAQTKQVMDNLLAVLAEAGADASSVLKTTCFLSDMNNFLAFNEVYASYFTLGAPARSCVEVARLPKDVLVEVEAVAYVE
ncbi:2-iminobutanoate/2-iminopropanoate deaminase [Oceanisphaera litoralis]|uniref:RidA family protein n=1 Tax=Oceanisphaera litoralis TaxID=225144 RepID=UPI0019579D9F|nr:RidA family protein [Oceanisphaera litoralis]MBM7455423.1 2-iminobutanoate/2-iminopropanoate deaminase [Oceanisphaera litoralis]